MKKFILLSLLTFTLMLPTIATCSIDSGETVCALPGFREKITPIYSPSGNINEFSGSPEARLAPINRNDIGKQVRNFAPTEADKSYNSSCQFGVCLQNRSTPLFQQTKQ